MKTAKADVNGDFGGRNFPADEALELKPGAHVMFLRNDADQRWVNGTLGIVTAIRDTVWVAVGWYRPGGKLTHDVIARQYLTILLDGIAKER